MAKQRRTKDSTKEELNEALGHAKESAAKAGRKARNQRAVGQIEGAQRERKRHHKAYTRTEKGKQQHIKELGDNSQQTHLGDKMASAAEHAGVPYSDFKKFGEDAGGVRPTDPGSSWKSNGGGNKPPGSIPDSQHYHFNPRDPIAVRDYTASLAGPLYQRLRDEGFDHNTAAEVAADNAIKTVRANFPAKKGQTLGLDLSETSIGSVRDVGLGRRARNPSSSERSSLSPATEKTAERLKQRDKAAYDKYGRVKAPEGGKVIASNEKVQAAVTKKKEDAKKLTAGQRVAKSKVSNRDFLRSTKADESQWINQQFEHGGMFHGATGNKVPGAYRRWQRYVNARSAGYEDRDNITEWLKSDNRGRSSTTNKDRPYKNKTDLSVQDKFTGGVMKKQGTKAKDRYKSLAPSHEDFGVGIRVPGLTPESQLREDNPDASDRDIFEIQQSERQSIAELLDNQKMAHETRHNTFLGRDKSESKANDDDRVVFFTTSTGVPAISASANSLLGQYIIKKRKRMLYDNRMASRAQLKGEFPYAVRDQHVMEVATGLTVGAQGRYGAFKHVGYRVGAKKSKGYGKNLPVGSQILRDSSGQPLYDRNGNLRYTEGFTRPFDLRPSNEVGMRIYLG